MSTDSNDLKWSGSFSVTPPIRTQKLPGDKILLPASALAQLLAAASITSISPQNARSLTPNFDPFNPNMLSDERQQRAQAAELQSELPHPLTFRIVNSQNGKVTHAGIREFSAE